VSRPAGNPGSGGGSAGGSGHSGNPGSGGGSAGGSGHSGPPCTTSDTTATGVDCQCELLSISNDCTADKFCWVDNTCNDAAKSDIMVATPLPFWVCSCHEEMWREHHDPLYVAMKISMVVELPYSEHTFTEFLQNKFKQSVAAAADTMLDRITIDSITTDDEQNRRRLLESHSLIKVAFSVKLPADYQDKVEPIRMALTSAGLNAQLEARGVALIVNVVKEAYLVEPPQSCSSNDDCAYDSCLGACVECNAYLTNTNYNDGGNVQNHITCDSIGAKGRVCVYDKEGASNDYYTYGWNDYEYGKPKWFGSEYGAGDGNDDDWFCPRQGTVSASPCSGVTKFYDDSTEADTENFEDACVPPGFKLHVDSGWCEGADESPDDLDTPWTWANCWEECLKIFPDTITAIDGPGYGGCYCQDGCEYMNSCNSDTSMTRMDTVLPMPCEPSVK